MLTSILFLLTTLWFLTFSTAKLSNKFSVNGTLNYTGTKFRSPPVAAGFGSNVGGDGASIFANIFYTPRSVDLMGEPFQNPVTGESIYYRQNNSIQNPLWTVANAANIQKVNRVFGGASLNYEISDNLYALTVMVLTYTTKTM